MDNRGLRELFIRPDIRKPGAIRRALPLLVSARGKRALPGLPGNRHGAGATGKR